MLEVSAIHCDVGITSIEFRLQEQSSI
jgi:hypothetical protein